MTSNTAHTATGTEPALCDHTIENCEWKAAVPQSPADQRQGAAARPDMVNVLGWVEEEGRGSPVEPGVSWTSIAVQAWVNNVAFAKDVWTDVYLVGDGGAVLCAHALPLQFFEPAGANGDCFVASLAAFRAPSASMEPRRLQFRLYYHVDGELFTDGLLHDHDLAAPDGEANATATPSRHSLMVSMLLLHQASARARRRS
jgi:hypothetical protein